MNQQIEDLMYHAGLTAQGCWDSMDEYDRQAIEKLVELTIIKCAELADKNSMLSWPDNGRKIKRYFGIEK